MNVKRGIAATLYTACFNVKQSLHFARTLYYVFRTILTIKRAIIFLNGADRLVFVIVTQSVFFEVRN
jgi:hypothetical protein